LRTTNLEEGEAVGGRGWYRWFERALVSSNSYRPCIVFLQRVSIACYAERCISHSKSVRLSVCPSDRPSVGGAENARLETAGLENSGTGKVWNATCVVWHNLVAHVNTEKCRPSLSHSYHHGAASVLDSVVTYSPSYFGEHTYNVAYKRTTFSPVSFPV